MKNQTPISNMHLLLASALFLANCTTPEPTPVVDENKDFSTINGKTIKTEVFAEFQLAEQQQPNAQNYVTVGDTVIIYHAPKLNTLAATAPILTNIKTHTDASSPVRYVAVGSSLTAGVRDGGYFNEGIQTSYPNLIARQMQIPFNQPYFEDADFNGFGRKIPTTNNPTGGPVQKFNSVKNNTGIASASGNSITLKKYSGTSLDNFGVPYLGREAMDFSPRPSYLIDAGRSINTNGVRLRREALSRILTEKDSYYGKIFEKPIDIITLEFRTTEVLNNLLGGREIIGQPPVESMINERPPYMPYILGMTPELRILRELETKNIKNAILLNVPDFLSLPYFRQFPPKIVTEIIGNRFLNISTSNGTFSYDTGNMWFLPTATIDSVLSKQVSEKLKKGFYNNPPLKNWIDVLYSDTPNFTCSVCDDFNIEINRLSNRFGYPIVDIKSLYEQIIKGTYNSYGGGKITSKEFFSTDGIYPSALGQACIANEIIKVMNTHYKSNIPLINIQEFR